MNLKYFRDFQKNIGNGTFLYKFNFTNIFNKNYLQSYCKNCYDEYSIVKPNIEIKTKESMVTVLTPGWGDRNKVHNSESNSNNYYMSRVFSCSKGNYATYADSPSCQLNQNTDIFRCRSATVELDLGKIKKVTGVYLRGNTGNYALPKKVKIYVSKVKIPGFNENSNTCPYWFNNDNERKKWVSNAQIQSITLDDNELNSSKFKKELDTSIDFIGRYVYFFAELLANARAEFGYVGVEVAEELPFTSSNNNAVVEEFTDANLSSESAPENNNTSNKFKFTLNNNFIQTNELNKINDSQNNGVEGFYFGSNNFNYI